MIYDDTADCAAEVAELVCQLFRSSTRNATWTMKRVSFEMSDIAKCSEFVRECCEAAMGCGDHGSHYWGGTARETERILRADGLHTQRPKRGDIVCFNAGNAGEWGHIGLCLGEGLFAENTSSTTRGPGFVISRLSEMDGRISGYYSILPARKIQTPPTIEVRVVDFASGKALQTLHMVPNGDHIGDQRKVYVRVA